MEDAAAACEGERDYHREAEVYAAIRAGDTAELRRLLDARDDLWDGDFDFYMKLAGQIDTPTHPKNIASFEIVIAVWESKYSELSEEDKKQASKRALLTKDTWRVGITWLERHNDERFLLALLKHVQRFPGIPEVSAYSRVFEDYYYSSTSPKPNAYDFAHVALWSLTPGDVQEALRSSVVPPRRRGEPLQKFARLTELSANSSILMLQKECAIKREGSA